MQVYLDFEKPIAELEGKIQELRAMSDANGSVNMLDEISKLESKITEQLERVYVNLDAWQKTQVARHPRRPHFSDYIDKLVENFVPLAGDRLFSEDRAIIAGLGYWRGRRVALLGHEKGDDTQTRLRHNFGMARPEGYRKAVRIMELAERFHLPLVSLVDTSGAYPGIGAEERGQAEAIARCTEKCLQIGVPFISVIIGEGGSGGALALATANRILMLEHSVYAVASPEACASILWRERAKASMAAAALKLTPDDLLELGVIDKIIREPIGGAHRERDKTIHLVGDAVLEELDLLQRLSADELRQNRQQKFLAMGRKGLD